MSRARTNADNSSADILGVTASTGLTGGGTSGTVSVALDTASVYVVPSQSTHSGKYLTTNGSATSWANVDALPSQTGNSGKYLTTNGTSASWATITTDPTPTVFLLGGM
jgi:trimeric autotransporter adhesin